MKAIFFGIAIVALTFTACSENSTQSKEADTDTAKTSTTAANEGALKPSTNEVVTHYLHLKNALAADNAKEAATAGKAIAEAIQKIDVASLAADQKKVYDDVKDDMKEHAEHISTNEDKIEHQREHFEMLSNDLYDLVKAVGSEQTLYKDHCPMYNNNKGANWLSEVKEIKNPYLGKKMPTCGTMKEEIK
jgi:predicted RNase H-like nuclease (RuvC/YqgF family)